MKNRLHDWLTLQGEQRPEDVAVLFKGESATYGALDQTSNRLARAFKAAGCNAADRVALLMPKSPGCMAAMFGALKADCIYVPIDTSSPRQRIERILAQCECRCVVADLASARLLNELRASDAWQYSTSVIWMDGGVDLPGSARLSFSKAEVDSFSSAHVDSRSDQTDAAHILFTSGSTGIPKGVVITHTNIVRFVRWAVQYFGIEPGDRISGHPPLHFDLSTFDIYGAVAAGAQLHMVPPEINLLPHRVAAFIRDSRLQQWFSVPSVLHNMARFDAVAWNDFPELKRLLWCGEAIATPDLRYWMQRVPQAAYVNLYGPTETTIASSYYRVPSCPQSDRDEIPIGAACGGECLMVLDDQLNPVARGEIGQLYIAGAGLSPGYWRDPAQTAQVFLPNPYESAPGDTIYKTGDLARIGEHGEFYLLGRADTQIKSRGYRIELGEIEAALGGLAELRDSAVVAVDAADPADGKVICCAFVAAEGVSCSPAMLKQRLERELPRYMIPALWKSLDEMPRNANGKTDRPALRRWFTETTREELPHREGPGLATASNTVQ